MHKIFKIFKEYLLPLFSACCLSFSLLVHGFDFYHLSLLWKLGSGITVFLFLFWLISTFLTRKEHGYTHFSGLFANKSLGKTISALLLGLALGILLFLNRPILHPSHQLSVQFTGVISGSSVKIIQVKESGGGPVPFDKISYTGEWEFDGDYRVTSNPMASLSIDAEIVRSPLILILEIEQDHPSALTATWDGKQSELPLSTDKNPQEFTFTPLSYEQTSLKWKWIALFLLVSDLFSGVFLALTLLVLSGLDHSEISETTSPTLSTVIFLFILLSGILMRSLHLFMMEDRIPFHMGGLFVEFSRQIFENNFLLPERIPYYSLNGIPFAYPPLAFYIESLVIHVFGASPIVTANLLPVILISVSLIPAFYLFLEISPSRKAALFSLFLFAITFSVYSELREAAGIAEALSLNFFLEFLRYLFRLHSKPDQTKYWLLTGLFWALCVLSGPGAAYASTLIWLVLTVILFVRHWISSKAFPAPIFRNAFLSGLSALLLSSPYWLTVLIRFGPGLFTSSISNQHRSGALGLLISLWENWHSLQLIEPMGMAISLLSFFSILYLFLTKRYPAAVSCLVLLVVPRESSWLLPPLIILTIGLMLFDFYQWLMNSATEKYQKVALTGIAVLVLGSFTWGQVSSNIQETERYFQTTSLSSSLFADLKYLSSALPIYTPVVLDADYEVVEWSPTLLQRTVISNNYGLEFDPLAQRLALALRAKTNDCDQNAACIQQSVRECFGVSDFVYLLDKANISNPANLENWLENHELIETNHFLVFLPR